MNFIKDPKVLISTQDLNKRIIEMGKTINDSLLEKLP